MHKVKMLVKLSYFISLHTKVVQKHPRLQTPIEGVTYPLEFKYSLGMRHEKDPKSTAKASQRV